MTNGEQDCEKVAELQNGIEWSEVFQTLLTGNREFVHTVLKEKTQVAEFRKFHAYGSATSTSPWLKDWLTKTANRLQYTPHGKLTIEFVIQARKGHEFYYVLSQMIEQSSQRKTTPL